MLLQQCGLNNQIYSADGDEESAALYCRSFDDLH